jgi:uncharacterized membrane protein
MWSVLTGLFFGITMNHKFFLLTLAAVFLMQFIYVKYKEKKWYRVISAAIPSILCIPIIWFMYGNYFFIFNYAYIIGIIITAQKLEKEPVDYNFYKESTKKVFVFFVIFGILSLVVDKVIAEGLYRYYVFLILTRVLLLRESRRFVFKIRDKKSRVYNFFISAAIILMSFNNGYLLIKKVFSRIFNIFNYLAEKIFAFILTIIFLPFSGENDEINIDLGIENDSIFYKIHKINSSEFEKVKVESIPGSDITVITNVFKVLLFIFIVIIIYNILKKVKTKYNNYNESVIEEKEKIEKYSLKNDDNSFKKLIKRIFLRKKNLNEHILYIYGEFEKKTYEKEIFKSYMTATQLSNVTKIYVDKFDELDSMRDIYNEAKFSKHEMSKEDLKKIKNNYENIKKEL